MLCCPARPMYHPIFGDSILFLKYLVKNDPIFCKFNISHVFSGIITIFLLDKNAFYYFIYLHTSLKRNGSFYKRMIEVFLFFQKKKNRSIFVKKCKKLMKR